MTVIVSFDDYTPVARYDDQPWETIQIEEAPEVTGPYTLIDTVTIDPVDADPSQPASRSFTTTLGTGPDYWYRVIFLGADAAESLPSVPLQNTSHSRSPYGTTDELALILHVREPENETALLRVLNAASAEIDAELGRDSPFADPPAIVIEVCLERAVEHWQQLKSPFGVLGLGAEAGPTLVARDSWDRHAHKLAPLKEAWGLA